MFQCLDTEAYYCVAKLRYIVFISRLFAHVQGHGHIFIEPVLH